MIELRVFGLDKVDSPSFEARKAEQITHGMTTEEQRQMQTQVPYWNDNQKGDAEARASAGSCGNNNQKSKGRADFQLNHSSSSTPKEHEHLQAVAGSASSLEEVSVAQWVRLCGVADAPAAGKVVECEVGGVGVCLANVGGVLAAVDNWCPHRGAALGQGWMEGEAVVCPWHSWAFNVRTGLTQGSEKERVDVFPVRVDGEDVMVDLT